MDNETKRDWPYGPATPAVPTAAIAKAFAAAQAELQNPAFDSTNPHFKSKFASLATVRNTVIPVLAKHGIALVQELQTVDGGVSCTTHLYHESGESLHFGPLTIPATKSDAHGYGSAATYSRRYSLMAVAGVVGDDDDDANAAVAGKADKVSVAKPISAKQAADINALIDEVGADLEKFCEYLKQRFGVSVIKELRTDQVNSVIAALKAKQRAAA